MPMLRPLATSARTFALATLAVGALLAAPVRAAEAQKTTTVTATPKAGMDPKGKRQIICRGAKIPAGWVLVDDLRDTEQCDGKNPAAVKIYNVWSIEQIEGKPSGTVIEICTTTPTPAGWALVDVFRDRDRCGHPEELFGANVKRIRKN
jgi:hypothetical protein